MVIVKREMPLIRAFSAPRGNRTPNPLIKRSQQGSFRGGSGGSADVDGGLRTVTDLIALLSMLLSLLAARADCFRVSRTQ